MSSIMNKPAWQDIAKEAQAYRDASIKRVEPAIPEAPKDLPLDRTNIPNYLLSSEEVIITQTAPEDLVKSLATELLPEQAVARAKFLDDYYSHHKKPVGPLHGLPISVKDQIGMKGLGLNGGFVSWWDNKAEGDAHVLKILWNAGCIFYARTTQPQTLMHLETSSNLYGETFNPFNAILTSGGSSGGEGALLGIRGSCLGLGTDIGGSVRSPSANCGIYGLRPSSYRIPTGGCIATMAGNEAIVPVLGPMSTSLEGVKLFMKIVLGAKPWLCEPSLVPIPWRDDQAYLGTGSGKKLKVAVMWHDGTVKPHPPVIRALREVTDKLKDVPGVVVVEWKPYNPGEAWDIISRLYFGDGGQQETDAVNASGEPWRPLSNFIIKENPNVKTLSVSELWHLTTRREAYRSAYAKLWNGTATGTNEAGEPKGMVDVILCPAGPGTAPQLNHAKYWNYVSQWDLLDYPALVFPVTKVDPTIDKVEPDHKPMSKEDQKNHQDYQDPNIYKGAPVSLQLVGRRYEDEKVVEATEFIKESVGLPFVAFV